MADSDLSSSSYVQDEGDSDEEAKPLKKRRISGGLGGREQRLGFDEPVRREVLLPHFLCCLTLLRLNRCMVFHDRASSRLDLHNHEYESC